MNTGCRQALCEGPPFRPRNAEARCVFYYVITRSRRRPGWATPLEAPSRTSSERQTTPTRCQSPPCCRSSAGSCQCETKGVHEVQVALNAGAVLALEVLGLDVGRAAAAAVGSEGVAPGSRDCVGLAGRGVGKFPLSPRREQHGDRQHQEDDRGHSSSSSYPWISRRPVVRVAPTPNIQRRRWCRNHRRRRRW
jgi:hypothetical protein